MSDSERPRREKRDKSVAYFWRALRYLAPHRRLVGISIGCAVLVGLTVTGGGGGGAAGAGVAVRQVLRRVSVAASASGEGDCGDLRGDVCAGASRQLRAVLPGIFFGQGGDPGGE